MYQVCSEEGWPLPPCAFDPSQETGERVIVDSVHIGGKPIDLENKYTIATKAYLRSGKDGFSTLKKAKVVLDPETAPRLVTLIYALLSGIQTLNDCLEKNGNIADCSNTCSVLRGTQLETLCHYDEVNRKYGVSPSLEGRISNVISVET